MFWRPVVKELYPTLWSANAAAESGRCRPTGVRTAAAAAPAANRHRLVRQPRRQGRCPGGRWRRHAACLRNVVFPCSGTQTIMDTQGRRPGSHSANTRCRGKKKLDGGGALLKLVLSVSPLEQRPLGLGHRRKAVERASQLDHQPWQVAAQAPGELDAIGEHLDVGQHSVHAVTRLLL